MDNYIEIIDFYKNYGKTEAVKGITFNVNKGDFFCLVGKNGAGKTTTLRALLNFIYPTKGTLRINKIDCTKQSEKIKKFTGYLSGENYSYNYMKVREIFNFVKNIEGIDSKRYKEEIEKMVDYFEIDINKKFSSLSHGNKRKVLIVSSLLKNPELLIYDEPTSGLDIVMRKKLINYLNRLNKEKKLTILYSTHIVDDVDEISNRIGIIDKGKIVDVIDKQSILSVINSKKISDYILEKYFKLEVI